MNSLSINHKRFKRLAKAKKLVTRFAPEDPLKKISNSNLIVECGEFISASRRGRC
jgi:hypothetical protein